MVNSGLKGLREVFFQIQNIIIKIYIRNKSRLQCGDRL